MEVVISPYKEYSEDKSKAGGSLGWMVRGSMVVSHPNSLRPIPSALCGFFCLVAIKEGFQDPAFSLI